jgi:folate-binding protein YgfZ
MNGLIERVAKGYSRWADRTLLYVRGAEGEDLLQRISTNDLKALASGPVRTVLTNEKGRIVDVVTVVRLDGQTLLLAGISRDFHVPMSWINRFIIMEDVVVEDASADFSHFVLPGEGRVAPFGGGFRFVDEWGLHVLLHRGDMGASIVDFGGEIGSTDLQRYRIIMGIPDWGSELIDRYNPLEAGLDHLVSWSKGCYVGQEVIARLDTYNKVQQHIVNYSFSSRCSAPSAIYREASSVGLVTSVAQDDSGIWRGLGYIRTTELENVEGFFVREGGKTINVTITGDDANRIDGKR